MPSCRFAYLFMFPKAIFGYKSLTTLQRAFKCWSFPIWPSWITHFYVGLQPEKMFLAVWTTFPKFQFMLSCNVLIKTVFEVESFLALSTLDNFVMDILSVVCQVIFCGKTHITMFTQEVFKGQLISEWLFGVFNFPKKQRKNLMNFCPKSGPIKKIKALYYV